MRFVLPLLALVLFACSSSTPAENANSGGAAQTVQTPKACGGAEEIACAHGDVCDTGNDTSMMPSGTCVTAAPGDEGSDCGNSEKSCNGRLTCQVVAGEGTCLHPDYAFEGEPCEGRTELKCENGQDGFACVHEDGKLEGVCTKTQ